MDAIYKAYGTWSSPITPKTMAGNVRLLDVQWNTAGDTLVWNERHGNNSVLVAQSGRNAPRTLTDSPLSVGGRVGYGGGGYTVGNGHVYFSANGRLYRQSLAGGSAQTITPKFGDYASPALSADGNWLAFVHSYEHNDGIALVDASGEGFPQKLAYGTDFVMQAVWHPVGTHLAYIAWSHPRMPWNGTELRLIQLSTQGSGIPFAEHIVTVAGDMTTAIFQPEFSPDGRYLSYISDVTGWGQLYIYDIEHETHVQLTNSQAEHGLPAWVQGLRTYGWTSDSQSIYFIENNQAFHSLKKYDFSDGSIASVQGLEQYSYLEQISVSPDGKSVSLIASASTIPARIVTLHQEHGEIINRRATTENNLSIGLSMAQAITWQGDDGEDVYGLYYAPADGQFMADGAPPLVVEIHGGPTSQRLAQYYDDVQFFTTRGYAYMQVNHRGSTGYGKAYMDKHKGNWGIYDVQDAISCVKYLVERDLADASKVVIIGGSAGGFTVLQSLIEYPGFYKAAICSYGVSNQFGLVMDTHKFEERYGDWLLGTLPSAADVYRQRSPVFHADKIQDAIIVFQGEDDPVVPKNQSDDIVNTLRRRGIPHEYYVFEGEGHGFRKPETIESYFSKIERFLLQYVIYA